MADPSLSSSLSASEPAASREELARLTHACNRARDQLQRLRDDVAHAEGRLALTLVDQQREANEHLVLAVLQLQADVESQVLALTQAARAADLDPLTRLPNRNLLLDRFTGALASARRHGKRLALLFVDLDDFKRVNDTHGHAAGDEVLRQVAGRLSVSVRESDTVSRHGGDEFVVLLTDLSRAEDASHIAEKMQRLLAEPLCIGAADVVVRASIGIGLFPEDGADAGTLLARADAAMYRDKRHRTPLTRWQDETAPRAQLLPASPPSPPASAIAAVTPRRAASAAADDLLQSRLRDANERLVLASLSAQEGQAVAQHRQRRQSDALAQVVRQLSQPIAPIAEAVSELRSMAPHDPSLPRIQATLERQVAHLRRLIGDLLDVSSVETGSLRLSPSPMDLIPAIDEAIDTCRTVMAERRQRFTYAATPRPLNVYGDAVRLTQVLSHLLDNASKHTPVHGEVGLAVTCVGNTVEMRVSDDGIGITAEALPHVFEPFAQGARTLSTPSGKGLGIGLAIVRGLVEAHGGSVQARSAGAGRGSQFTVSLPLIPALPADGGSTLH